MAIDGLPEIAEPGDDELLNRSFQFFEATKNHQLQNLSWAAEEIVVRFNLKPFYAFYCDFVSSVSAPSDNSLLGRRNLIQAYEEAWHGNEFHRTSHIRGLLVAALFRDFEQHTSDSANIDRANRATAGLALAQRFAEAQLLPLTQEEYGLAIAVIQGN